MMSEGQLAEIAARNQERPNDDVTALLAENEELKNREMTFIRATGRDVLSKLWEVRRLLLYQKPCPKEYTMQDTAIARLEEDLGW